MMAKITCSRCKETQEYDDDGVTFDCMPDGVMVDDPHDPFTALWVCSDCMVDKDGNTLQEFD